jgi:pilus assembly protein CpaE
MALLPLALLVLVLAWQVILLGLSFVWCGHASAAAVRSASLGQSDAQVVQAARDVVPASVRDDLTVSRNGDRVTVQVSASVIRSYSEVTTVSVDTTRRVVTE